MVAERRFTGRASAIEGTSSAMATGQLVCFPGWETLRAMTAEQVKEWILSQERGQNAQYL